MKSIGLVILLATAVGSMSGCAGDSHKQSTGEYVDDKATASRVRSRLSDDTVYKYPDVKVTVFKGTAQLSGFVAQKSQKDRASDLAKNVAGVKEVVNNITVKE